MVYNTETPQEPSPDLQATPAIDSPELVIQDMLHALNGRHFGADIQESLDRGETASMHFFTVHNRNGVDTNRVELILEPSGNVGLAVQRVGASEAPSLHTADAITHSLSAARISAGAVLPALLDLTLRRDATLPGARNFIERAEQLGATAAGERLAANGAWLGGVVRTAKAGQLMRIDTLSGDVAKAMVTPFQKALPRPEVRALSDSDTLSAALRHDWVPTDIRGYHVLESADGSSRVPIQGIAPWTDPSTPIPNLTAVRKGKNGYDRRYRIDDQHPLHNESLVDLRNQGFPDAKSYYATPNKMTGEPLPGVPDAPLVRLDVARRLREVDERLRTDPDVHATLGGHSARLRVDDALREPGVQHYAYDVAWPAIIRKQYAAEHNGEEPSEEYVLEKRKQYIAEPSASGTPTPHLTGGAVDVWPVDAETGEPFNKGYQGGSTSGTAYPDYHEGYQRDEGRSDITNTEFLTQETDAVMIRRVLYWAMRDAGLEVNATEIWHYGTEGDPLGAYMGGTDHPYYGIAELPPEYKPKSVESPDTAAQHQA